MKCKQCQERWAQEAGLCRRCRRAQGDTRPVALLQTSVARISPTVAPLAVCGPRYAVYHGVEFEVVFDGSRV